MQSVAKQTGEQARIFMSLSLEPDEGERYREILRRARQNDPFASKSDVIRSLFEFPGSNPTLLKAEDREFFFQRKSRRSPVIKVAGNAEADGRQQRKTGTK